MSPNPYWQERIELIDDLHQFIADPSKLGCACSPLVPRHRTCVAADRSLLDCGLKRLALRVWMVRYPATVEHELYRQLWGGHWIEPDRMLDYLKIWLCVVLEEQRPPDVIINTSSWRAWRAVYELTRAEDRPRVVIDAIGFVPRPYDEHYGRNPSSVVTSLATKFHCLAPEQYDSALAIAKQHRLYADNRWAQRCVWLAATRVQKRGTVLTVDALMQAPKGGRTLIEQIVDMAGMDERKLVQLDLVPKGAGLSLSKFIGSKYMRDYEVYNGRADSWPRLCLRLCFAAHLGRLRLVPGANTHAAICIGRIVALSGIKCVKGYRSPTCFVQNEIARLEKVVPMEIVAPPPALKRKIESLD